MLLLYWTIAKRFSRSLGTDGFARFTAIASIASIAIGCFAVIVSMSVLRGYEEQILEVALRFTSHIEIRPADGTDLILHNSTIRTIKGVRGVIDAEPVLLREALARTRGGVDGVIVQGLPQGRLRRLLPGTLVRGNLPATAGEGVVGSELARTLALDIGDTLALFSASAASTVPTVAGLRVCGIFTSGMSSVDGASVITNTQTLRQAFGMPPTAVSMIAVELNNPSEAYRVAARLLHVVPGNTMLIPWQDRYASISGWIELQKKPIPIIMGLICIVAIFTTISSLLVSVVLKTRSLAILASLGMSSNSLMMVVLIRALRIGISGSVLGSAMALLLTWVQHTWKVISLDGTVYYLSSLPVSLNAWIFITVPMITIVLSAVAAVVPMLRISRLSVSRVLRWS